jgi:hypothetical protein
LACGRRFIYHLQNQRPRAPVSVKPPFGSHPEGFVTAVNDDRTGCNAVRVFDQREDFQTWNIGPSPALEHGAPHGIRK